MIHICKPCDAAIEEALRENENGGEPCCYQFRSLRQLEDAKEGGCCICKLAWKHHLRWSKKVSDLKSKEYVKGQQLYHKVSLVCEGKLKIKYGFAGDYFCSFFIVLEHHVTDKIAPFAKLDNNSLRDTMAQANDWLSECRSQHTVCDRRRTSELPTRLIKVDKFGGQLRARLVDSDGMSSPTHYLALSYDRKDECLSLKKDNEDRMRTSIPLQELSTMFQDALNITQELGFSYIWISELCIIQGSSDEADWERKSPTESRIYSNSICILSATSFRDVQLRLFPDYSKIGGVHQISNVPSLRRTKSKAWLLIDPYEWVSSIDEGPLGETIWRRRALHFTKEQLYWNCCSLQACEVYPNGHKLEFNESIGLNESTIIKGAMSAGLISEQDWIQWREVVSTHLYTSATRSENKLPAVSALAERFSTRFKDQYLAGLWRKHLLVDMLWAVKENATTAPVYRAPTWSWASVDGGIYYPELKLEGDSEVVPTPLVEILSADTMKLVPTYPFGRVISGKIVLSGFLREIVLEVPISGTEARCNFLDLVLKSEPQKASTHMAVLSERSSIDENREIAISMIGIRRPRDMVYLVPLVLCSAANPPIYGIILRPKEKPGEYERVGYFNCRYPEEFFADQHHTLPPNRYQRSEGQSRYTITIV